MSLIKKFNVNNVFAKEGDSVSVSWDCNTPDSVNLFLFNGYRKERIGLFEKGTKDIFITKSRGVTKVTLMATLGKKKQAKTAYIFVRNRKILEGRISTTGKIRLAKEKAHARWCQTAAYLRYWWEYLPKKRKTVYKILLVLWLAFLFFSIASPSNKSENPQVNKELKTF